jgi:hypothetical protein
MPRARQKRETAVPLIVAKFFQLDDTIDGGTHSDNESLERALGAIISNCRRLTVGFYVTALNEAGDFESRNILPMLPAIAKVRR